MVNLAAVDTDFSVISTPLGPIAQGYSLVSEVKSMALSLGRYSVFSLQCLDALCFIAVAFANRFDAGVKATKLELLMQLDGELVDVDVGGGCDSGLGEHTFHLEDDRGAVWLTLGSTEGEGDVIDFVFVSDDSLSHRERNLESSGCLSFDFLLDREAEHLDGALVKVLLVRQGQRAVGLPWPVGVVEDFEVDDLGLTWQKLKDALGLFLADGASLFPALLAVEVPVLATLHVFGLHAHLVHEFLDHALEGSTTSATAMTTSATAASAATTAESLHHLVDELHGVFVLCFLVLGFSWVFITKHGDHNVGSSAWLANLEEGVLVVETLLASGAVVEVLADAALEAKTTDWAFLAAITGDALVDSVKVLSGLLDSGQVIGLKQLLEDISGLLLKLVVDKVLEGLPRDALDLLLLALFLAGGGLRLLVLLLLHLLVFVEDALLGSRLTGGLHSEGKFFGVAHGDGEGQFEVIVVFNDHPAFTVIVAERAVTGIDSVLGGQGLCLGRERGEVGGSHSLNDGALSLCCQVNGQLDVESVVCCFNHLVIFLIWIR